MSTKRGMTEREKILFRATRAVARRQVEKSETEGEIMAAAFALLAVAAEAAVRLGASREQFANSAAALHEDMLGIIVGEQHVD